MSGNFFAYISRMRLIRRWSLMHNNFPENIQEHSHRVALLAHVLATIGQVVLEKSANPERAAFLALLHDANEVMTGDLPTPVKYFDDAIREAYRGIEEAANKRLLSFLPDAFQPAYEPALFPHKEDAGSWEYVRAADKLCAWLKCVEERRGGNREFLLAEEGIKRQLDSMEMAEIQYFMDNFAPGFSLTLDELGDPDSSGAHGWSNMEKIEIKPAHVCADRIDVSVKDGVIQAVEFDGGCAGNAQALGRLLAGMTVDEAVRRLAGVDCEGKGTSCADQLARGLSEQLLKS